MIKRFALLGRVKEVAAKLRKTLPFLTPPPPETRVIVELSPAYVTQFIRRGRTRTRKDGKAHRNCGNTVNSKHKRQLRRDKKVQRRTS